MCASYLYLLLLVFWRVGDLLEMRHFNHLNGWLIISALASECKASAWKAQQTHTEREKVRGWRRGGDNRRQKMVSFLIPVKKLIHLIFFLVPVHPGFISFVRARRESCTQLILTICSNPCLTFATFRSRNSTLCRASKWPCEQNKNALQVHCITFANGSAYQISRRALRKGGLIEMCKW